MYSQFCFVSKLLFQYIWPGHEKITVYVNSFNLKMYRAVCSCYDKHKLENNRARQALYV